jgi:glycosyltransferase involved in cell wall biosynthesis
MIVRNEAERLERCLLSAKPFVDEMVVVDTGSEDGTVEIAKRLGARIDFFTWINDFSAARNYALSLVRGEWILILDADEVLVMTNANGFESLRDWSEIVVGLVSRTESHLLEDAVLGGWHTRVFRNRPGVCYVRRYHEQLCFADLPQPPSRVLSGISIIHYGNSDPVQLREKTLRRDIPILESIRAEEGLSLWLLDCLGRNYLAVERDDLAQGCYEEALDRLMPHLLGGERTTEFYWVTTLIHFLALQCWDNGDLEMVRLLCQRGLEWCPNHVPLTFLAGELLLEFGFPLGAIAYFERCIQLGQTQDFYGGEPFVRSLLDEQPQEAIQKAQAILNRSNAF